MVFKKKSKIFTHRNLILILKFKYYNTVIFLDCNAGMPLYIRLDIFVSNGPFDISIYPMLIKIYPIPCFSKICFQLTMSKFIVIFQSLGQFFSIEIPNLANLAIFWKLDFKVEEVIFLSLHRSYVIRDTISNFDRLQSFYQC